VIRTETLRAWLESTEPPRPIRLLRAVLLPGSATWRAYASARRAAYTRGWLGQRRAPLPVISIGNLVAGGTGKTPLAIALARDLLATGHRPAVLLRGYGASTSETPDEVQLVRQAVPDAICLANPDRGRIAAEAAAIGADVALLDDGFQHLRLAREADIVVLDAANPFGGGHCLPAGLLREPPCALARATAIILTAPGSAPDAWFAGATEAVGAYAPEVPVFTARHRPMGLQALGGGPVRAMGELAGERVVALTGIARPKRVVRLLEEAGASAQLIAHRDHHRYTPDDLERASEAARRTGATRIVTTAKDAVKLAPLGAGSVPVDVLEIDLELGEAGTDLRRICEEAIREHRRAGRGATARA
jgi:tetraacyldisaccharide 4'-kinase